MAISKEIQKSSEMMFDGKLIKVTYDIADVNGNDAWREVVHHPGATAIVVVTEDNKIVMERQFRYALQTGYRAKEWISLGTIATSPGFCNEVLHLYLAKDLTMGETHWDPD